MEQRSEAISREGDCVHASTEGGPAGSADQKNRFRWISLSLSAFLMSFAATALNVFYAVQGPEIVIQPPRNLLLYRDGEGDASVLGMAVRLEMLNSVSDYSDVLLSVGLKPQKNGPEFMQEGLAQAVFVNDAAKATSDCGLDARCVAQNGLLVAQRSDSIMDVPGGAARALTPYFWLVKPGCEGTKRQCVPYATFSSAVSALSGKPLEVTIKVSLQNDGERVITCRTDAFDADYLRDIGWTQIPCRAATVTGDPLL